MSNQISLLLESLTTCFADKFFRIGVHRLFPVPQKINPLGKTLLALQTLKGAIRQTFHCVKCPFVLPEPVFIVEHIGTQGATAV